MVGFNTDHYFHIGEAHLGQGLPCQDFAYSEVVGDAAFAIVADGCSTGGMTDVGSRVVALAAAQAVREYAQGLASDVGEISALIRSATLVTMSTVRRTLALHQQDLLATCVYAAVTPAGGFVHLQGDGVVAFKYVTGQIILLRYDWDDNMPCYPVYGFNNFVQFIAAQGGDATAQRLHIESWEYNPDTQQFVHVDTEGVALGNAVRGLTLPIMPEVLANGLEFVAVFTDGVTQIEGQDWKQAVIDLLAFKNVAGAFAKRRMIRHIKDSQKSGRGPMDDIAYSVIRIAEGGQHATQP